MQADVADGEEGADAVLLRLLLVAVVLEVGRLHRHVDGADHVGLVDPVAVVVEDGDLADRPRLADRAGLLQPLLGGDQRAAALAGGVVLVDRVAPPGDHLVLHVDRARRRGVDHVAQRGHVVLGPHVLGQRQQAVELGRHHVRGGDPALLDEAQHVLGQPLVHEHDGVAQVQRRAPEAQHGGVVQRRADDVDVVVLGLDAEEEQQPEPGRARPARA